MHSEMRRNSVLSMVSLLCMVGLGCSNEIASNEVASAQSALEQARDFLDANDAASAMPLLNQALEAGGLNADQAAEALLRRARCHLVAGNLDAAQADLSMAEQGAPEEALLRFTRGLILKEQGKDSEARKELAAAKRLDPSLKMPE